MKKPIMLLALFSLFTAQGAFAGGSISREQAMQEVCHESATLCRLLYSLSLAPQGDAIRTRAGERMMPYHFEGRLDQDRVEVTIGQTSHGTISVQVN